MKYRFVCQETNDPINALLRDMLFEKPGYPDISHTRLKTSGYPVDSLWPFLRSSLVDIFIMTDVGAAVGADIGGFGPVENGFRGCFGELLFDDVGHPA